MLAWNWHLRLQVTELRRQVVSMDQELWRTKQVGADQLVKQLCSPLPNSFDPTFEPQTSPTYPLRTL